MLRIVVDFGVVVKESGRGREGCVLVDGAGVCVCCSWWRRCARSSCATEVGCGSCECCMQSSSSPSGQNVVCVTSAFSLRPERCLFYISFNHPVRMWPGTSAFTIRSERCLCDVGFHHQVGMLSVTSAFTIWLERCLC